MLPVKIGISKLRQVENEINIEIGITLDRYIKIDISLKPLNRFLCNISIEKRRFSAFQLGLCVKIINPVENNDFMSNFRLKWLFTY